MIADKDRSGYFGASDTDKVVGNWGTKTFETWWLQKDGINRDQFNNRYTSAGTCLEHRILESLGTPMVLDRQVIDERLKLRVNLDGDDGETIYECKTYKLEKGYILPQKHVNQVLVQMYATGLKRAYVVSYGLCEEDYDNYFLAIDKDRLKLHKIEYDARWIEQVYLPRLEYLAKCLKEGRFPKKEELGR